MSSTRPLTAPWASPLVQAIRSGLLIGLLLIVTGAWAQERDDPAAVRALEAAVQAYAKDAAAAKTLDERRELQARGRATLEQVNDVQGALSGPIEQTQQRIEQLGTDAASSPDPAVRQQHLALTKELAAQVALTRRTALARVQALQAIDELNEAQARAVGEELFERSDSPLTPSLWRDGVRSLQEDFTRAEARNGTPSEPSPPGSQLLAAVGAWLVAVLLLAGPVRKLLLRWGTHVADRLARRQLSFSRASFALWSVLVSALLPTIALLLAVALMHWATLPAWTIGLIATTTTAIVMGLYVRATALAVLQPAQPARRMWRLSDAAAALGMRAGNTLAAAIGLIVAVEALVASLDLRPASAVFVHSALALASTLQIAHLVRLTDRMRLAEEAAHTGDQPPSRGHWALLVGLAWLGVALLALFGVLGYVSLANRMSQWAIWGLVVALTTFLLMAFVDGLSKLIATASLNSESGHLPLQQAAVLLSAVCRLLLLALACGALLVPFGAGFTSVLGLFSPLATGFEVGGVRVSAAALLKGLLAFAVVMLLIRLLRSWIRNSYFPTTGLQSDAQDSIDKILRYLGIVLAILWALTAFGVGMEKVAILASALSVGIGFGLQAITQNFVSGLILLVERPVRIGDWVKVNDVEGDIRRINVRSTEINVGDHSTMIVPNSELITKVVQNKTLGNSLGRAQILLSVPVETDLDAAIAAIHGTLVADQDVLASPAPAVFLDRVEGGMAVLNAFVHVHSPRVAYEVRSRLLLATLRTLRARDIAVTLPPQKFVMTPAANAPEGP